MTRFWSRSPKRGRYSSVERFASTAIPGVQVTIRRMSLGRRIDLARAVRDRAGRLEFLQAATTLGDRIEASQLGAEIDAVYLRWGLVRVEGLTLDDSEPFCEEVIARAPEPFVREIVDRIKRQCGLSEPERKN